MEDDLFNIEKSIQNLCILINTEYSSIGVENIYGQAVEQLIDLEPIKALNLTQNLINDLIESKERISDSETYKAYLNQEVYQKALQRLQREVRGHIKAEQQIKVYIESLRKSGSEKKFKYQKIVDEGEICIREKKQQNLMLAMQINQLEGIMTPLNDRPSLSKEIYCEQDRKNAEMAEKLKIIQTKIIRKKEKMSKSRQCQKSWRQQEALSAFFQKKYQSKANELWKLHSKLSLLRRSDSNQRVRRTASGQSLRMGLSKVKSRLPMSFTMFD